ncbi:putative ATP-dependent RNA helicase ddx6, partial [Perkinsus olseni]
MPPHVLPYAEDLLEYLEPKSGREFSRATLCRSDTTNPAYHQCIVFCTSVVLVKTVASYLRENAPSPCKVMESSEDHSLADRSAAMKFLNSREH